MVKQFFWEFFIEGINKCGLSKHRKLLSGRQGITSKNPNVACSYVHHHADKIPQLDRVLRQVIFASSFCNIHLIKVISF
jgi:hypothetical protein